MTRATERQRPCEGGWRSNNAWSAAESNSPTATANAFRMLPSILVRTPTRTPPTELLSTGNSVKAVQLAKRPPTLPPPAAAEDRPPSPVRPSARFRPQTTRPPAASSAEKRKTSRCCLLSTTSETTAPRPESAAPATAAVRPQADAPALSRQHEGPEESPLLLLAAMTEAAKMRRSAKHCSADWRSPRNKKTKSAVKRSFVWFSTLNVTPSKRLTATVVIRFCKLKTKAGTADSLKPMARVHFSVAAASLPLAMRMPKQAGSFTSSPTRTIELLSTSGSTNQLMSSGCIANCNAKNPISPDDTSKCICPSSR
mmetsp:Transcript_83427/g.169242  ORF Transcript_83427/g.169242 Transcript_83427/m.169242 type:complete len:312 (-) Transcript_83427:63-998(-)